jgi:hypothetical protein
MLLVFESFMTLGLFTRLIPRINFLAILILGIDCWCVRWMIEENNRRRNEFKENLEDIENIIRINVGKKAFFIAVGKTEGLITLILNQLN